MRMLLLCTLCMLLALVVGVAQPAAANDLQRAGARTVELAENLFQFTVSVLQDCDAYGLFVVDGDRANAVAAGLTKQWVSAQGMYLDAYIGLTQSISGDARHQPVGGATVRLASAKGWEARAGATLCSADISSKQVMLGPISAHYAFTWAVTKPN
jgi:hypothetical protein